MRFAGLALAFCLAAAGAASAQAPATPPLTPGQVTLRLDPGFPTRAPAGAARPGAPGVVGAVCRVGPEGRLAECKVMEERPAGAGLGAWLLTTFSHARVGPVAKDGTPTAGRLFAFRTEVRADPAPPASKS